MTPTDLRRDLLSRPLYAWARTVLPEMSATEAEAIQAGDVWWDAELFTGAPDWDALLDIPPAELTAEEQDRSGRRRRPYRSCRARPPGRFGGPARRSGTPAGGCGPAEVVRLHPKAADAYHAMAESLHLALEGDDASEVRDEIRALIDGVVLTPLPGRGNYDLEVSGKLKALLQNNRASRSAVLVGAGAGFEPATFRL